MRTVLFAIAAIVAQSACAQKGDDWNLNRRILPQYTCARYYIVGAPAFFEVRPVFMDGLEDKWKWGSISPWPLGIGVARTTMEMIGPNGKEMEFKREIVRGWPNERVGEFDVSPKNMGYVFRHKLSEFCKITKPGVYTLLTKAMDKGDNYKDEVKFRFYSFKPVIEKMFMPPPLVVRDRILFGVPEMLVRTGFVELPEGRKDWYVSIGPSGKEFPDNHPWILPHWKQVNKSFRFIFFEDRDPNRFIPIDADTKIEKVAGDYRARVWMLLTREGKSCVLVWDLIKKQQHWVIPWTKDKIELVESGIVYKRQALVFAVIKGKPVISTYQDIEKIGRENEIEAEVQKRLAAELKKRGIKQ